MYPMPSVRNIPGPPAAVLFKAPGTTDDNPAVNFRQALEPNADLKPLKKIEVRDNERQVYGNLYLPDAPQGTKHQVVLVLGGSTGGISDATAQQITRDFGYATFAQAYFHGFNPVEGADHLPKELKLIPLETFERGFKWLQDHPDIDGDNMAVMGRSKGGEASALIASYLSTMFPLKLVSPWMPSHLAHEGIDFAGNPANVSSWSFRNMPVHYAPYGTNNAFWANLGQRPTPQLVTKELYQAGMDLNPDRVVQARIPVELAETKFFFVAGDDDQLWNSAASVQAMRNARAAAGFHDAAFIARDAGHVFAKCAKTNSKGQCVFPWPGGMDLVSGGTPEANERAGRIAWRKFGRQLYHRLGAAASVAD